MDGEVTKEIQAEREYYEASKPEAVRKYFEDGLYKVGAALARNGVIPPSDIISFEPKALSTDEEVAQMLAGVEVDDPHFKKIDMSTDEGKQDATTLAVAKLTAVAEQRPDLKKRLQEFGDKAVSGVIDFFENPVNPARKVFLKAAPVVGLALATAACGPNVIVPPVVPEGGGAGPTITETATEVLSTPTQETTSTPEPTATQALEISQDIQNPENLPHLTMEFFTSQEFNDWVKAKEESDAFPEVPKTAVPFKSLRIPKYDMNTYWPQEADGKYGKHTWYLLSSSDIKTSTYYNKPGAFPGIIAAAWNIDNNGEADYGILFRMKNPDNTYGFFKAILPKASYISLSKALTTHLGYQMNEGVVAPIGFPNEKSCQYFYGSTLNGMMPDTQICNWYFEYRSTNTQMEDEFIKHLAKGMFVNNTKDSSGNTVFFVPTSPITGIYSDPNQGFIDNHPWYAP